MKLRGIILAALAGVATMSFAQREPAEFENELISETASSREILVKFTGSDRQASEMVRGMGDRIIDRIENLQVYVIELGARDDQAKAIATYSSLPGVEYAEVNGIYTHQNIPNDPFYNQQWALPAVQAPQAWNMFVASSNVTIAIIDTGVNMSHVDLAGRFVAGYDFVNNDSNAADDQGHGTHCAGIAAGIRNNGTGIAGLGGGAMIMPVKVLNSSGSGSTANIAAGIDWASANGADVLSLSLGGSGFSQTMQDAVNLAWSRGSVIVAAAGNSNTSTMFYPAGYVNAIAVGSTTTNGVRSSFSNFGATWVDVAAPGSNIYSTLMNGGYGNMSGTSMACPLVAGLAGMVYSQLGPFATNTQVRRLIEEYSDRNSWTARGQINARRTINATQGVNGN